MKFEDVPVYLVDDDVDDLELLHESLTDCGFGDQIVKFNSSVEFWDFCLTQLEIDKPCVIIMDLNMPSLKGIDILAMIKIEFPSTAAHIIILSTSNNPFDIDKALHLGAKAYHIKPTDLSGYANLCILIKQMVIASMFLRL